MKSRKFLCVISILTLVFCIPQAQAVYQDEDLADEEKMVQAIDAREKEYADEQARENSYDVPQEDDIMKTKEEDRDRKLQYEDRSWY